MPDKNLQMQPLRIYSHDFGGYPYPAELARCLAARGNVVRHAYCANLVTTPQGGALPLPDDPASLELAPIDLGRPLNKFSFLRRWQQERAYGRLVARDIAAFRPDVILSANSPLDAQKIILTAARKTGAGFVFWVQDLIGIAAARLLRRKIPVVGRAIGSYYERLEARLLRSSDQAILITEDFRTILDAWQVDRSRTHVIENWAPLKDLPVLERDNKWGRDNGLADYFNFLYAGTLGMKHNPELLLALARSFRSYPDVRVTVMTQGPGSEWLKEQAISEGLVNLHIQGFVPFRQMPEVMASADVLVAILEPDAGVFSVPSKVLAYLCGGKALLTAMPLENLASRILQREHAGVVCAPDDVDAFVREALELYSDDARRARLGRNARAYAEAAFDIGRITDAFEPVLRTAARTN
jgi:colanic acid biosynthesis glycosyl transferase WcaI